jgi:hypothetical protein
MKGWALILTIGAIAASAVPAAFASGPDATTVVRYVDLKHGQYQLEVENTSGLGYITSFTWDSPGQLQLTAISNVTGGRCHIADNQIQCTGAKHGIAPPSCTCRAGGHMVVNFTATGNAPKFNGRYWTYYGVESDTVITGMTPVETPIPSWMGGEQDLPLCSPGTQPGPDNPCYVQ